MVIHVGHDFADRVLIQRPAYFHMHPPKDGKHANSFAIEGIKEYRCNPLGFRRRAVQRIERMAALYEQLGVEGLRLPPNATIGDAVYTADPTLALKRPVPEGHPLHDPTKPESEQVWTTVVLGSNFSNKGRKREVSHTLEFLKARLPGREYRRHELKAEGTGDNIYDAYRDVFWSGFTPNAGKNAAKGRSALASHEFLSANTGVRVVSLEVKAPFFHIDTSLFPLSRGHMLVYPDGMSKEAFKKFKHEAFEKFGLDPDKYMIVISRDDANAFAANGQVVIDERTGQHTVVTAQISKKLQKQITDAGYGLKMLNMKELIAAGGSVHCTSQNVDETRVPGGWASYAEDKRYRRASLGIREPAAISAP